jgi:uncharacterized protein YdeI (YjbR/CyaY-like superfamily)
MAATFRLEPDSAARVVNVPPEFHRALSEEPSLRRWFDGLSHSTRNEFCKVVAQAKSPAARLRRALRMAECLLSAMEAERELPPALQMALAHNSLAHQGWQLMSPLRRRGHLVSIFYYQSLEARANRIEKAVQDAAAFAEKRRAATKSAPKRAGKPIRSSVAVRGNKS